MGRALLEANCSQLAALIRSGAMRPDSRRINTSAASNALCIPLESCISQPNPLSAGPAGGASLPKTPSYSTLLSPRLYCSLPLFVPFLFGLLYCILSFDRS